MTDERQPPLGPPLDWTGARRPPRTPIGGEHVLLRPLDAERDTEALYQASHAPGGDPAIWRYLADGPYESPQQMRRALASREASEDPLYLAVADTRERRAGGIASYLRIVPEHGVIEIGNIWFGPALRRTTAATEAIQLLLARAFDELGYRRVEWKCDARNDASRRAARRFGFAYEGLFRNHMVVKGRSRDTAWYAMTADEWPAVSRGFRAWMDRANFDGQGRQRATLAALTESGRRPSSQPLCKSAPVSAPDASIMIEQAGAATPELVEAVAGLVRELSSSAAAPTAAELERIVSSPATRLLLARDEERTVGMLTLATFAIPTGVRAWIEDVVVTEGARGRGVGELLSREALRLAEELGARTVELTSRPSRQAANRLYARIGFEQRETNVYRYTARGSS